MLNMTVQLACHVNRLDINGEMCLQTVVSKCNVTYIKQAIPSPFGMPAYEMINMDVAILNSLLHNALSGKKVHVMPAEPDFTGNRVKSYMSMLQLSAELITMFKYVSLPSRKELQFTSSQVSQSNIWQLVMECLHPLCHMLMANARTFQQ